MSVEKQENKENNKRGRPIDLKKYRLGRQCKKCGSKVRYYSGHCVACTSKNNDAMYRATLPNGQLKSETDKKTAEEILAEVMAQLELEKQQKEE